jgi:hypothetical protein
VVSKTWNSAGLGLSWEYISDPQVNGRVSWHFLA